MQSPFRRTRPQRSDGAPSGAEASITPAHPAFAAPSDDDGQFYDVISGLVLSGRAYGELHQGEATAAG